MIHPRVSKLINNSQNSKPSVFALDLRSLALFRVAIGLLLLADLVFRWPTMIEMCTDEGMVTRKLSFEYYQATLGQFWNYVIWSFYWISGSSVFAKLLFVISGVFAFMLLIGKWTRVATIGCWAMWISLHVRNPFVITSGDFLLKMTLFWSIFLPLGATWSMDSLKRAGQNLPSGYPGMSFASLATVGYILQLMISYLFPGIEKLNDVWFRGEAMAYVLRLDIYITEFGRSLLEYGGLLTFTSWATLFAEVVLIWTLLFKWQNSLFRWINIVVFWSFHIGIGLSMSIGLFPFICSIAWLPLIPGKFWRGAESKSYDSPLQFSGRKFYFKFSQFVCGIFCFVMVGWNISNIESLGLIPMRNTLLAPLAYPVHVDQHFQMFGKPPVQNPWFVYEAKLADGSEIDIFRDQPVDHKRPEWVRKSFPGFHWRKVHRNLLDERLAYMREPLLTYMVDKWNADHDETKQVVRARLLCYLEDIGPNYSPVNRRHSVWSSYGGQASAGSVFDSMLDKELKTPF